ncbi:MAG: polysaccharide biosynthesis/export family protein [Mucilaginibacter sp.]
MNAVTKEDINNFSPLIIQPGDILAINVTSLNPEASAVINYNLNRVSGINSDSGPQNAVIGYLVDLKGNINLPLIGESHVSGLTTTDLIDQLQVKLQTYLSKPIVNVRILNFKVSVLGDVAHPDVYNVPGDKITLLQALGLAGDLNVTGIRNNILLIREIEGKREFVPIDLTSKKLFNSPYYYLKNNDIIYVVPNKEKVNANNSNFTKVSLLIGALSVIAIVLSNRIK